VPYFFFLLFFLLEGIHKLICQCRNCVNSDHSLTLRIPLGNFNIVLLVFNFSPACAKEISCGDSAC
jgi:hypothetical protein